MLGASCALSNAAVLFSSAGQLVNEANVSLSTGLSRDASASDTLYFKYTVTNPASNYTHDNAGNNYFAGMQFYNGASESVAIGNGWGAYAYSAFAGGLSGDVDLNTALPATSPWGSHMVESTDITTIVFKVNFVNGGNDTITAWVNPDLSLAEAAQSASLTTTFSANATFTDIVLREGGGGAGWNFSNIVIADSFASIPEPSAALLGGLGMLCLLRRRRS